MANVELNVRTQLNKIVKELQEISGEADNVGENLAAGLDKLTESLNTQTQRTQRALAGLQSFGGRVASQLVRDFKALASINALAGSLKFSEMFRGAVKETLSLNDAIRKLGNTLGIAGSDMVRFQDSMSRGLGEIGLSSEAAAKALEGLSQTPVRGQENLIAYSKTAGQLASISKEQGQEGAIAQGLSKVVTARGGNPNDVNQMKAVADDLLRIRLATGKSASEILSAMDQMFSGANKAFQKRLQGGGAVTLASAALIGGKGSTSFLERYLGSNRYQRAGMEAQGLGKIVDRTGGLSLPAMEQTLAAAKGRGMGDAQAGLTTFGMSDEEAQGFIRLTEAMRQNAGLIEESRKRQVDINQTYRESMGLLESFSASLNKLKGLVPTGSVTQKGTSILQSASQSAIGAGVVAGSAGLVAALLAGGGLRGIGKAAGLGGLAKGAAVEGLTGREVVPVYVVNAAEIGGGGLGGLAGKAGVGGLLGTAGLVGAGVAVGAAVIGAGKMNYDELAAKAMAPMKEAEAKHEENIKILESINAGIHTIANKNGRQIIELNKRELKESRQPNRGGSFGPTNF